MINMDTEQEIVTCSSEGKHSNIGLAIESAAAGLRTHLAELNRQARNPVVVSVSHSSGYIGHSGYFANIIAVINVQKKVFGR